MSAPGTELLRPEVLAGVRVVLVSAGDEHSPLASAVERRASALGARVARCETAVNGEPIGEEDARLLAEAAPDGAEVLVLDGPALFAAARPEESLLATMQACWDVTRAIASGAMLERDGGLIVLLAPRPGAGANADAARAGLENLARTLSIEWARFATRVVTVAPGEATSPDELAELVAYLASPAGSYYSGCLLDLRGA